MTKHEHAWTEHQPGTWGAGIVRACSCGLYDIVRPSSPGLTDLEQMNAARATRLWAEQGFELSDEDPTAALNTEDGGER